MISDLHMTMEAIISSLLRLLVHMFILQEHYKTMI